MRNYRTKTKWYHKDVIFKYLTKDQIKAIATKVGKSERDACMEILTNDDSIELTLACKKVGCKAIRDKKKKGRDLYR